MPMITVRSLSFLLAACIAAVPVTGCSGGPDNGTDSSESEVSGRRSYTGKLVTMFAIGSETTGTALQLNDGRLIELDLSRNHLGSQFSEDKKATVVGKFETVIGIEIHSRQVLVVDKITVVGGGGGQVTTPGHSILT